LELVVATGAIGGIVFGIGRGSELASDYVSSREAVAASSQPPPVVTELPAAKLAVAVTPAVAAPDNVYGAPDAELLAPVAATPLKRVKANQGGTSLSLRLEFENGARAAFKPEQTWPQSDPRREIAAFRIDRLLGIGHVPPAKSGKFSVAEMLAATDPAARAVMAKRLSEEGIIRHGTLRGELSWWIPEIFDMKIAGHFVDEPEGFVMWMAYLQPWAQIPAELEPMIEQLATCVVFDVLIDNADRWSGWNTKSSQDFKVLYFMDNTLSFSNYKQGHGANLAPLYRMSVFPRALVGKLRALTKEQIEGALGEDPNFGALLDAQQISAILSRRDHILHHIDRLIREHGEDVVLALP
jgi:hypothetical protein